MDQRAEPIVDVPLVVDLDGTLIKVNSLHEAFVQLWSRNPIYGLRATLMLNRGRAAFKAAVAEQVIPDVGTIPVDDAVLGAIKQAKVEGRKVYLATAADRRLADAIAKSIGMFDRIFASEGGINLRGEAKADCLIAAFGVHGFDYLGNDTADIPVWRAARAALICGASPRVVRRLSSELPGLIVLTTRHRAIAPYLLALRPHQWFKNVLLALPTIAAHDLSINKLVAVLIAFMSFSLGASCVYLVNDMLDLPHDREHPRKRYRSLAAGAVPVKHAAILFGFLSALSIAMALMLPWIFGLILIAYFGFSITYSLYLKRKLMIDVVALAMLYGIRVFAGGAATGIVLSDWLVGFCFFMFLSLALVKRSSETISLAPMGAGKLKGRNYRREDLQTITALAAASGFVAVLVFALYINSPAVRVLYRNPELLWGICFILVYWLGRVYFLTGRRQMNDDPVIFAATDRISLLAGVLVFLVFLAAM